MNEYSSFSDKELLVEKERLEKEISTYNNKQMSLKICLNSAN